MKNILWNKLGIAILSTILFAFIFTFITTKFQQETWIVMYVVLVIVGPCYLIGGIVITSLIDEKVKNKWIQFVLYLVGGGLVSMLFFLIFMNPTRLIDSLLTSIYGIVAALIFWLVQFGWTTIRKGKQSTIVHE